VSNQFVAEIRLFAGNFAPVGWAFCDGQVLPIAQNTALFSLVGTYYGGDGKANFALPDLRGRAAMQQGQGPGLTLRDLGESGGSATVALLESEMPPHAHPLLASALATTASPSPAVALAPSGAAIYGPLTDPVAMAAETLAEAGGGQPHENRQPYLVLSFIIALQGIFPPRS